MHESLVVGVKHQNTQNAKPTKTKPPVPKKTVRSNPVIELSDDIESFSKSSGDEAEDIQPIVIDDDNIDASTIETPATKRKRSLSEITATLHPTKKINIDNKENRNPNILMAPQKSSQQIYSSNPGFWTQNSSQNYVPIQQASQNSIDPIALGLKKQGYLFCLPTVGYAKNPQAGFTPYLTAQGKIQFSNNYNPTAGAAMLSYVCDVQNKKMAFVVKSVKNTSDYTHQKINTWAEWYQDKFEKYLSNLNSNDKYPCIFIFNLDRNASKQTIQNHLEKLGELFCTKKTALPFDFMFFDGNNLSQIYSADDAKKCYIERTGTLVDFVNKMPEKKLTQKENLTSDVVMTVNSTEIYEAEYEKLVENVVLFAASHPFCQTMESGGQQSYKEQFLPDEFIKMQNHYSDLLAQLKKFRSKLTSCNNNDINPLLKDVQAHIDHVEKITAQLPKIREEYVGDRSKEQALRKQWIEIKKDKSFVTLLPKDSERWFENNAFLVLTRVNEAKITPTNNFFQKAQDSQKQKTQDYQKLSSLLCSDFYRHNNPIQPGNPINVLS